MLFFTNAAATRPKKCAVLKDGPDYQATEHGQQHHGIETGDLSIPEELPCRYQQQIMLNSARALLIPT